MPDGQDALFYTACFLFIAVAIVQVTDLATMVVPADARGYGSGALPLACDVTRHGAGPEDHVAWCAPHCDSIGKDPLPRCAMLTRDTRRQPAPDGEGISLDQRAAAAQDAGQKPSGGTLRLIGSLGATSMGDGCPPVADACAATAHIFCAGPCAQDEA